MSAVGIGDVTEVKFFFTRILKTGYDQTMSKALLLLTLSLSSVGCATGDFTPQPGQAEATRIVWHDLYGMDDDPPPVEWIEGDTFSYAGRDVEGFTWIGWKISVAKKYPEAHTTWSIGHPEERFTLYITQTAFAHELMHYKTFLETGDVDIGHNRGGWELADHTALWALMDARL